MPQMSESAIQDFVARPRLGYLTTLKQDGSPSTFPMWVEWDGSVLRMFTSRDMLKLKRIERDPRINVTIGNDNDEKIQWVCFEGSVKVIAGAGKDLALRLADLYWGKNPTDAFQKETVAMWEGSEPEGFRLLELRPDRVNSFTYAEASEASTS